MSDVANKKTQKQRKRRVWRVRSRVSGSDERPRLRITISNRNVEAQIINDDEQKTIVSTTTVGKKSATGNLTDKAAWAGKDIAKKAKTKKVNKVVLDRGSRRYHGRVKAFADAARDGGLEF